MTHLNLNSDARLGMCFIALFAALLIASPSVAGTVYSWTTEDGGVAYTDDLKNVPARYRSQVKTRTTKKLEGYKHYTPQDKDGSMDYSQQLAARLTHLRELNAQPMPARRVSAGADSGMLEVGGGVHVPMALSDEPIVNERVRVRPFGDIQDRNDVVISQGGRPISIIRGRDRWQDQRELDGEEEIYGDYDQMRIGDTIELFPH